MARRGGPVGWYVNDGTKRHDFVTLDDARAFWEAHPRAIALGEWVETCRRNERGAVKSRHGNVTDRRDGRRGTGEAP